MRTAHSKSSKNIFKRSYVVLAISIVLAIFFTIQLISEIRNRQDVSDEIKRLEEEIALTTAENQELSEFIDSWHQSSRLEKEARLKLGLQKPGERVVVIDRPQIESTSTRASGILARADQSQQKEQLNITKWWNYFFN
jgi:cell division protein FtsL